MMLGGSAWEQGGMRQDTRAALVEHFKDEHFVHPSALFAPDPAKLADWLSSSATSPDDDETEEDADGGDDGFPGEEAEAFQEAAE